MPIRTKPFTQISLADVEDLIAREVQESHTLEYKRTVDLQDKDAKVEFLKDVSAMANASGGTIIYGVVEGEGENRGFPVGLAGLRIEPDTFGSTVDQLIRDGLDERLTGVLHTAIPFGDGAYIYVLRVPASPLAPHMVTLQTSKPRHYLRANTVSAPMNMRQVKETVMQRSGAIDRAREIARNRVSALRDRAERRTVNAFGQPISGNDQVILHVVPLFPAPGGWNLGPEIESRLLKVPPFGYESPYDTGRYSHEGYIIELEDVRHVFFLRSGAIEFLYHNPLDRQFASQGGPSRFPAYKVEHAVREALRHCATLTEDGLLPLPVLLQLSILDVQDSKLQASPHSYIDSMRALSHRDVLLEPVIITSWDQEASRAVRQMFNEMWQAWGLPQSWNRTQDGQLIE